MVIGSMTTATPPTTYSSTRIYLYTILAIQTSTFSKHSIPNHLPSHQQQYLLISLSLSLSLFMFQFYFFVSRSAQSVTVSLSHTLFSLQYFFSTLSLLFVFSEPITLFLQDAKEVQEVLSVASSCLSNEAVMRRRRRRWW